MEKSITPQKLKSSDKVALVATARKISQEEIHFAIDTIKGWGLEVVLGSTIGKEAFQFAGTDEERLADFQTQLDDDSVKAIICARGGYGTVRFIDDIDFRKFSKKPKWICGYSDITVLHSHLLSVYNIASVHSTMPLSFKENTEDSLESLRDLLFGENVSYKFNSHPLNKFGKEEGILCGGNLSLLQNLSGTDSDIDTDDKILFIEDVDEYLYHFDRMLQWMKRSGKLENLAGLVVGHLTKMKNLDDAKPFGKTAEEIIMEAVRDYEYPVCFGFPAGHENDNRALILGGEYLLDVNEEISELKML
ncbi:peptidase S66 [Bacteroidota bacterium]|nr:peptidase S66 [Bacteroidota bacterium]